MRGGSSGKIRWVVEKLMRGEDSYERKDWENGPCGADGGFVVGNAGIYELWRMDAGGERRLQMM